jgi:PKD repeat protein
MKYYRIILLFFCAICSFNTNAQQNRIPELDSPQHLPPVVDFGWTNACFGDTVKFYNASYMANTYTWTISSTTGTVTTTLFTSSNTNISFYFPAKGVYSVELDGDNGHIISVIKSITIDSIVSADFSFLMCMNIFSNMSTCATTNLWDFGDGTTSTAGIPVHQYADTGKYTVKLIVSNGIQSDTINKQLYITATHIASSAFTYYQSGDTVFFHAIDTDPGEVYYWNWGDFTNSTGRDTFHVYVNSGGAFVVTLLARNGCGNNFGNDTVHVIPTGIKSYGDLNSLSLSVFPNPAIENEDLNISVTSQSTEKMNLSLYNVYGQKFLDKDYSINAGQNFIKMKTDGIKDGTYFIFMQGTVLKGQAKFVIRK